MPDDGVRHIGATPAGNTSPQSELGIIAGREKVFIEAADCFEPRSGGRRGPFPEGRKDGRSET